jgi:guanylate kinase
MRENHQLQFPTDIQIIYVAPPALDEIKRWLREQENTPKD